jgi:hypothetical protein
MTTQLLTKDNTSTQTPSTETDPRIVALQKAYSADQQVKYLHLDAEINVLLQQLQQLQTLKNNI